MLNLCKTKDKQEILKDTREGKTKKSILSGVEITFCVQDQASSA